VWERGRERVKASRGEKVYLWRYRGNRDRVERKGDGVGVLLAQIIIQPKCEGGAWRGKAGKTKNVRSLKREGGEEE